MVKHTPGRTDHHVSSALEIVELTPIAGAAVDRGDANAGDVLANLAQLFADLDGQLARGRQNQRLGVRLRLVDALDQRNTERGRLAGAGLSLPDHVAALEQQRDDPRLDLCRPTETHRGDGPIDLVGEHQLGEAVGVFGQHGTLTRRYASASPRGRGNNFN